MTQLLMRRFLFNFNCGNQIILCKLNSIMFGFDYKKNFMFRKFKKEFKNICNKNKISYRLVNCF